MRKWLLARQVAADFHAFRRSVGMPSAEQTARFLDSRKGKASASAASSGYTPECLTIAGDVALIKIEGILTEQPDFWAWLFGMGNTAYCDIRDALALAGADPAVKRCKFDVASPGGEVFGLFETFGAVEAFPRPIDVDAAYAASAAYALSAVTGGKITARTRVSEFGSVGIVQSFYVDEDFVEVTSTDAPNKRPDVTTDAGKEIVRQELDPIHNEFASAIARGRTRAGRETTLDEVNQEFGRGGMLIAEEAKRRGMIDKAPPRPSGAARRAEDEAGTGDLPPAPATATDDGGKKETKTMDIKTLEKEHPELYALVIGKGATDERKRVTAHLNMGKNCGNMDIALKAISAGTEFNDPVVQSEYMGAAMNRGDQANRQAESDAAGAAVSGAAPPVATPNAPDLGDQVADLMARQRGKKTGT